MLCRVVGSERYDGVCECGFSEDAGSQAVLCMVRSRKFSVQLSSGSAVNRSLGCKELKSFSILCMSDWLGSYIIRMSSTYLQQFMIPCFCVRSVM